MPGRLTSLLHVMEWDLRRLWSEKVFVTMRFTWFAIQVLVFARAISLIVSSRMVAGVNYYDFYLLGIYVSALYSVSISRGYVIADEFDDGLVEYHLSLPIERWILVLGRILGSSLSALVFTIPMMLVVVLAIGYVNPFSLLTSILMAYVFSIGVVSLVITVVMRMKSTDITDILFGTIDAILVRLSSIFYPLPVIEASGLIAYYYAALANPISSIADFLRLLLLPEYTLYAMSPQALVIYILGFSMGLAVLAIEYYARKLEAGGWK
ncbi:MAG: ABC transporter [Desulfurococcus sp.]|nr:ABC transporter [Desulfurococcus sp.]